jgi:hypothetical protein
MTTYTSPFTGNAIQPTDVSYEAVALSGTVQLYWPQYVSTAGQQVTARIMDVVSASGGILLLPDAQQTSVGQDILFRNQGANPFTVSRSDGTGSFTVPVGQAYYTYLTDNTTSVGVWQTVAFGVGTSYADAATLAGNSTAAILGKLETTIVTNEYSSSITFTDSSRSQCFVWTGGAATTTLPAVSSLSSGWYVLVRNNGTGALTINTASVGSTIDGLANLTLPLGDSCFICVNQDPAKQDFFTVGRSRPNSLTFSSATYDVDVVAGSTLSLITNTPIIQRYTALSGTRTTNLLVQLPAVTQVYYLLNDTNQSGYDVTFQIQGSSQPPFSLPTSTQVIALSDGTNLYPLLQTNVGQFLADRGSAASPAFTFTLDPVTGMYSPNNGQLGFSVAGTNIVTMDATAGVGNYVTRFVGRVQADLISGGSF